MRDRPQVLQSRLWKIGPFSSPCRTERSQTAAPGENSKRQLQTTLHLQLHGSTAASARLAHSSALKRGIGARRLVSLLERAASACKSGFCIAGVWRVLCGEEPALFSTVVEGVAAPAGDERPRWVAQAPAQRCRKVRVHFSTSTEILSLNSVPDFRKTSCQEFQQSICFCKRALMNQRFLTKNSFCQKSCPAPYSVIYL